MNKFFFLAFLVLLTSVSAYTQIQDAFTERTCTVTNGKANCISTIYSQPQFYEEATNYSVWDNTSENVSEHRWDNGTSYQWKEITTRLKFKFWNTNTTFSIQDREDVITLTPIVKTATGQLRSFDFLRGAGVFESLNFTVEKDRANWKFSFGLKWYANISTPQAIGFIISGDDGTYSYSNGTFHALGKDIDFRQMHREGFYITQINRTMILFKHDAMFERRTVISDPTILLNANISGSEGMTIYQRSNGTYLNQDDTTISLGKDPLAVNEFCGFLTIGNCRGYFTFNVSQIPRNANVSKINLSFYYASGAAEDAGTANWTFSKTSPIYNNGTSNATQFTQYWDISNGFNYSNYSFDPSGEAIGFKNTSLSISHVQQASVDLMNALTRTDVFKNNFTIGVSWYKGSVALDIYTTLGSTKGGTLAPRLTIEYAVDAAQIQFVPPTPANATTWRNQTFQINVTTNTTLNHSVWVDFNRSLLGWWAMDWKNTTQVFDNSTYRNHLNMRGNNYGANNFSQGARGNATNFDGVDDHLSIADSANIRHGDNFTISIWFKKVNEAATMRLANKNSSNYGWHLIASSGGSHQFYVLNNSGATWFNASISQTALNNTWYQLVGTFDGRTAKVYLNGRQNTGTAVGVSMSNNENLTLGVSGSSFNFLNGSMDEIMYWNRTLSATEVNASFEAGMYTINERYNVSNGNNYTYIAQTIDEVGLTNQTENRSLFVSIISPPLIDFVSPTPANNSITPSNLYVNVTTVSNYSHSAWINWNNTLLGYWRMDQNNASGILDNSTYGATFFYGGAGFSSANITPAVRGLGTRFDGVNDQFIRTTVSTQHLNITPNMTITMWVNPVSSLTNMRLFARMETGGNFIQISKPSTDLYAQFYYNGVHYNASSTVGTMPPNLWNHFAIIFNGTGTTMYLNGRKINTVTTLASMSAPSQTTNFMTLGSRSDNSSYLDGWMDEIMIFNRSLSADEVNASMDAGIYRLFNNFTGLNTSAQYQYQSCAMESTGASNCTETRSTTTITPKVAVSLTSPPIGSNFINSESMNFTATISTNLGSIKNATLYGNFTSLWTINATNTTALANNTLYQFFNIPINESAYIWNVQACDTNDVCAYSTSNSSFRMTRQAPTVNLIYPANGQILFNGTVNITASATSINNTIKNATLWINSTGTFSANSTITSTGNSFYYLNLENGYYLYNIRYCDVDDQCAFAPANFTFLITIPSPPQGLILGNEFWTTTPFFMLAILFLIVWFYTRKIEYAIAASIACVLAGTIYMNGIVEIYPATQTPSSQSCVTLVNATNYPAFNLTTTNETCSFSLNAAKYTTRDHYDDLTKGFGYLFFIIGLYILFVGTYPEIQRRLSDLF